MIALKLLGIEWFKTWRRVAFWVATVFLLCVFFLQFGISQMLHAQGARTVFSLPADWGQVLAGVSGLALMCMVTLVALLVASEQTWRTQRQNVIDGLSRGQYFSGKVLLTILLALFLCAVAFANALVYAAFDGAPGYLDGTGPLLDLPTARAWGGVMLFLLGVGAMTLMFAIVASGSGAAMAFSFLLIIVQQPLIYTFAQRGGMWRAIGERLPHQVLSAAAEPGLYIPETWNMVNTRAASIGAPRMLPPLENTAWAVGYVVLFVGLAWLAFRRRDL